MVGQNSTGGELQGLARVAARSLHVPFVTIALDAQAAKTVFVDSKWANSHAEIDVAKLDNASAVSQNIPFFACVPIRNGDGETVGTLCCGDSNKRDLAETEIRQLKQAAQHVALWMQREHSSATAAHH